MFGLVGGTSPILVFWIILPIMLLVSTMLDCSIAGYYELAVGLTTKPSATGSTPICV